MTYRDAPADLEQTKVLDIMRSDRFCMMTTVGDQGRLHSHPMTWDTPGGRVATALSFVKTKLTGERPSGNSDIVELR